MEKDSHSDDEIKKFYTMKNIAVVGMSKNEEKAAHYVPRYLIDHGYNVFPLTLLRQKSWGASHILLLAAYQTE